MPMRVDLMNDPEAPLIERVCTACCDYYKPGKAEPERCGGFRRLATELTAGRLRPSWEAALQDPPGPELSFDRLLDQAVCQVCPFRAADCDYRDPDGPADATPCGGLRALDRLLARGLLRAADLSVTLLRP
ncbi:MAG: hypothetical protein HZB55_20480 [Deltaproteobacteria bacterium]|nr:hypothetical protein [Deltaproteobacteria bacterium]